MTHSLTDFRALCDELVDQVVYLGGLPYEQDPDEDLMTRASAALAEPEPEVPTDQELKTFACEWWRTFGFVKDKATCRWVLDEIDPDHFADFARDVLARWGK